MISTDAITTSAQLTEQLSALGFISEASNSGVLLRTGLSRDTPSRFIPQAPNNFEYPVVLAAKQASYCVYFYDETEDLFRIWDTFRGEIAETLLRNTVIAASSGQAIGQRLQEMSKTVMAVSVLARRLGTFVEAHDLGWVWQGWMKLQTARHECYVDTVFFAKERLQTEPKDWQVLPAVPDLIIKGYHPTLSYAWADISNTVMELFNIGVSQIWLVLAKEGVVVVYYASATQVRRLGMGQILPGQGLLNSFQVSVADIMDERNLSRSYPLTRVRPHFNSSSLTSEATVSKPRQRKHWWRFWDR